MSRRRSRVNSVLVCLGCIAGAALGTVGGCPLPGLDGNIGPPPADDGGTPSVPGNSGLTGKFIGAKECSICHSKLYESWSETRHAKAFERLEELGQEKNEVCLACHSTGFGQAGGFADRATTDALANVGCEACHGAALDHRANVEDRTLRPPKSMSAEVCGQCHNGYHHATFDEWAESNHGRVTAVPAASFTAGRSLNSCGACHSGDFRQGAFIEEETVPDSLLAGKAPEDMNAVTCAVCHDPHQRTGNAFQPGAGRDLQLRYVQIAFPTPSNSIADATNPDRFNLCGQCHHSRGRTWQTTDRAPHESIQGNFYTGEMPVPDGTSPLLPNERTVHAFVPKQCSTCHMQHHEFVGGEPGQTHAGHQFAVVSTAGCSTTGCHPTPEAAAADKDRLQAEVQAALDDIKARLGDPATWEYSSQGGPAASAQAGVPEAVKQIRFLYYYVLHDESLGVHNPEYARAIIRKADELLTSIGR